MTDLRDDLVYFIGEGATERAFVALLAHAAREDVVERCAKRICLAKACGDDRVAAISWGYDRAALRDQAKAALAAFLQGEGERT